MKPINEEKTLVKQIGLKAGKRGIGEGEIYPRFKYA